LEDEKIVDLYLDRNEDAIRLTKEKYGPRLRRMAEGILGDREEALECGNDACLEIWNLIPPHEPRTYLFAFAGRILRHLALDRCRKRRRQKRSGEICLLTEEMQECIPGKGEGPEDFLEAGDLAERIDAFLAGCPAQKRRVFVKRYWFFEPVSDIAYECGMSESRVKSMLLRMRRKLKEYLKEGGYEI
jgi:RNA polymerase sigma-70 factor (ECF subfamily)